MKFSCTKENFSQALGLVSGVTGKNINLPILNNILLKTDQQKVEVAATNLELGVTATVRCKTEQDGSFTVPARTLTDFVSLLPNEKIDISLNDNELVVVCGKSSTKIKGAPAEEFPVIPAAEDGRGFLADASVLRTALSQVLPAAAKNDIRPELAGILFSFNVGSPGLVLAATDSYRLAEKKTPLLQGDQEARVIVPARTAQELQRMLMLGDGAEDSEKQARIMVTDNQLAVTFGSAHIVSRLVEGNYPDYVQIIPKDFQTTVTVPTAQLVKEMKAAGLFTTSGVNAVTLEIQPTSGVVEITSTSTQTGEYKSELAGDIQGGQNKVLLNNRYVLDGLNNITSDEVVFKIINADSPCVFLPQGDASYQYIVMPIRQ